VLSQSPGTAVMISHFAPRYTQAVQCFSALQLPAGSRSEHHAAGLDLAAAREEIAGYFTGDWLFFVDDDHLFQPDVLMRLLARLDANPDVDVVAAYVLRRWPPHYTVAGRLNADGTATVRYFGAGSGIAREDLTGLGGGSVIRRSAFERIRKPWFTGGKFTEDWTFCSRLKAAGGTVAVDLDIQVGHITPMAVYPVREADGSWGVAYVPVRAGTQTFTVDMAHAVAQPEPVAV
jgi:cellulose synthase/poly-beta-1,6-N-acetylglucosamine synthase-like glycosyltransferase